MRAQADRVHGSPRDLGGEDRPGRALDLKPLYLRRREAGEEPPSAVTQVLQPRRPEECKMFACAKLACTPALVRSPGRAGAPREDLSAWSVHVVEWGTPTCGDRSALTLCGLFFLSY